MFLTRPLKELLGPQSQGNDRSFQTITKDEMESLGFSKTVCADKTLRKSSASLTGKLHLAREGRFYECQGVQLFILSWFASILSFCHFVFHLFGQR